MKRRPTTQDVTWLLDLARNKQLDLNPHYQRRSVWTPKDRQYFLDTIFRDYPSPAIFLHKSISGDGQSVYHVVDGKQRLETILAFAANKLSISKTFGDVRLDGKRWRDLDGEQELKHRFWNYQIPVEMVESIEGSVVNEVFSRLNRNSRKLTAQELRHAKYEGWLITTAEAEAEREDWKTLGVVTTARAKRMADTQFISELLLVMLKGHVIGFDQDQLDLFYAEYDDPVESVFGFSEEKVAEDLADVKAYLLGMESSRGVVTRFAKAFAHFYTLWAVVALNRSALEEPSKVADKYRRFMERVEAVAAGHQDDDLSDSTTGQPELDEATPLESGDDGAVYYQYSRGASTDLTPRQERYRILVKALLG